MKKKVKRSIIAVLVLGALLLCGCENKSMTIRAKVWSIEDGNVYFELIPDESGDEQPTSFYMPIQGGKRIEDFQQYDIVEITFDSYGEGEYMPCLEGVRIVTTVGSFTPPSSSAVLTDVTLTDETKSHILQVCDEILERSLNEHPEEVTNRNNPLLEVISGLPDQYYQITEPEQSDYYYRVTYHTEGTLGDMVYYLDQREIVVGSAYRD